MHEISEHPGVVTLDGDPIEVTIGLETERIMLYSNGSKIGSWAPEECVISESGPGSYLIIAENEQLPFLPESDDLFQAALGTKAAKSPDAAGPKDNRTQIHAEEAPPHPVTMIGFYLLATVTAAFGLWALWSMVL